MGFPIQQQSNCTLCVNVRQEFYSTTLSVRCCYRTLFFPHTGFQQPASLAPSPAWSHDAQLSCPWRDDIAVMITAVQSIKRMDGDCYCTVGSTGIDTLTHPPTQDRHCTSPALLFLYAALFHLATTFLNGRRIHLRPLGQRLYHH